MIAMDTVLSWLNVFHMIRGFRPLDRREMKRERTTSRVQLYISRNMYGSGLMTNFSSNGAYIKHNTPWTFYLGQRIQVMSEITSPLSRHGEIVRVDRTGVGIRFDD